MPTPTADNTPISANATTAPQVTAGGADLPKAKLIPHPYEGQETCNACHSAGSPLHPMPATHEGRSNVTCVSCHKPAGPKGIAPPVPSHGIGYDAEACLTCHAPAGERPLPASHAGRTIESCLICH